MSSTLTCEIDVVRPCGLTREIYIVRSGELTCKKTLKVLVD